MGQGLQDCRDQSFGIRRTTQVLQEDSIRLLLGEHGFKAWDVGIKA